jgi:hypothetical protein
VVIICVPAASGGPPLPRAVTNGPPGRRRRLRRCSRCEAIAYRPPRPPSPAAVAPGSFPGDHRGGRRRSGAALEAAATGFRSCLAGRVVPPAVPRAIPRPLLATGRPVHWFVTTDDER